MDDSPCPSTLTLSRLNLAGTYAAQEELMTSESSAEEDMTILNSPNINIDDFYVLQGSTFIVYSDGCQNQ